MRNLGLVLGIEGNGIKLWYRKLILIYTILR